MMEDMSSKVFSSLVGKHVKSFLRVLRSHGLLGRVEEFDQSRELDRANVPFARERVGTVLHPLQLSQCI